MSFISSLYLKTTRTLDTAATGTPMRRGGRRGGRIGTIIGSNPAMVAPGGRIAIRPTRTTRGTSRNVIGSTRIVRIPRIGGPTTLIPTRGDRRRRCGAVTPRRLSTSTVRAKTNGLIVIVNRRPFGVAVVATGSKNSLNGIGNGPIMFDVLSPSRPCRRVRGTRDCAVHFCPAKRARPAIVLRYGGLPSPTAVRNVPHACMNRVLGTVIG